MALGNVTSAGQETIIPRFPTLPVTVIGKVGGYYGEWNENTHNLYEEIPCLGVLAEQLMAAQNKDVRHYESNVAPEGLTANSNLLGYYPLTYRKNGAISTMEGCGVTTELFMEDVHNTALNLNVVTRISGILAKSAKGFQMVRTSFELADMTGSRAQLIQTIPAHYTRGGRCVNADNEPSSLDRETVTSYGIATAFGFQGLKENDSSTELHMAVRTWCSMDYPAGKEPPAEIINNRNDRRNVTEGHLPDHFLLKRFTASSYNSSCYRSKIISLLKKT